MSSNPLEALLTVIGSDAIRVPQIDPKTGKQAFEPVYGECLFEWHAISTTDRIAACRSIMSYLFPKLAASTVTGADNGPVAVATLDISQILANPELAKSAQTIALQIAEQRRV
jgi:hypothetical protein